MSVRERILEVALSEFAEFGFDNAKLDRVAESARTSRQILDRIYTSKDQLYRDLLDLHLAPLLTTLADATAKSAPFDKIFQRLSHGYKSLAEGNPLFAAILFREVTSGGERIWKSVMERLTHDRLLDRFKSLVHDKLRRTEYQLMEEGVR